MTDEKTEMPKPVLKRTIVKEGEVFKISANETAEYTPAQLDEVYKSLISTKMNIEGQMAQATAQKDQLIDHILPNMTEKLEQLQKDMDELKTHVSEEAQKFSPPGMQPMKPPRQA